MKVYNIFLVGLVLTACFALKRASASGQIVPLGTFVGFNPNGNNAVEMAGFNAGIQSFAKAMGKQPTLVNAFVDFSTNYSSWPGNSKWAAWSWSLSSAANFTVVLGVPMVPSAYWNTANQEFDKIASGAYDSIWQGIILAWKDQGHKVVHARIGWEHNGSWYPWRTKDTDATKFIAAWRHIAQVMHSIQGIVVKTTYNPTIIAWEAIGVDALYPGDDVVDVLGIDAYSTCWPGSLWDWTTNELDKDMTVWLANSANRVHYWDWPGANQWTPENAQGWGMVQHLAFAQKHKKTIAFCESGVGVGPSNPTQGLADDPVFPKYLRQRIDTAGIFVEYIMIWDANVGDGHWKFSDGSKAATEAAWHDSFGAGYGF